jgi:hypothetical protein
MVWLWPAWIDDEIEGWFEGWTSRSHFHEQSKFQEQEPLP